MENFNLKKFLVENKLTTNSKMLNEEVGTPINYEKLKQILLLACNTYTQDDDVNALFEKDQIKHTIKAIMTLAKGVADEDEDVFDVLENNPPTTLEGTMFLDDTLIDRWDQFDIALSTVSDVSYEYDFDDAARALNSLAREVDNFQL